MTYGLDDVTTGADDERSIVVGVISLANSRRATVLCSGFESGLIECTDLSPALGGKGDLHRVLCQGMRTKPELRLAILPEASYAFSLDDKSNTERLKGMSEEGFALRVVAYDKADVVNGHVTY